MADGTRLRVNAENAVYEEVDGELIVIDLANGSYYSLSGCGPTIWQLLVAGASAAEVCDEVERRFEVSEPAKIEAAVSHLLAQLREHELVVAVEDAPAPPPSAPDPGSRQPYAPPVLERYTDMKDYFLLDPIHEVDPAGWPKPAA